MASVTIRNLSDEALRKLTVRAAKEGLSREEFVRRSLLLAADAEDWDQEFHPVRQQTKPPAGLAETDARERRPTAGYHAPDQQSLLPVAGSGRGLWGRDSTQTIRKLRDEWSR